jgi:hypothetical protein
MIFTVVLLSFQHDRPYFTIYILTCIPYPKIYANKPKRIHNNKVIQVFRIFILSKIFISSRDLSPKSLKVVLSKTLELFYPKTMVKIPNFILIILKKLQITNTKFYSCNLIKRDTLYLFWNYLKLDYISL